MTLDRNVSHSSFTLHVRGSIYVCLCACVYAFMRSCVMCTCACTQARMRVHARVYVCVCARAPGLQGSHAPVQVSLSPLIALSLAKRRGEAVQDSDARALVRPLCVRGPVPGEMLCSCWGSLLRWGQSYVERRRARRPTRPRADVPVRSRCLPSRFVALGCCLYLAAGLHFALVWSLRWAW